MRKTDGTGRNIVNRPRGGGLVRALVIAAAGLLLGVSVFFMNASLFAGGDLPMPFGYGASVVMSGSMQPTLQVNDVIIFRREADYEVGDVVVWQQRGMPVVHRLIARDGSSVTTRGDANNAPDSPVSASDIRGRVIGRVAGAGTMVNFFKSPLGLILTAGGAVLLLEYSFRRQKERDDRQLDQIREEIRKLKQEMEP